MSDTLDNIIFRKIEAATDCLCLSIIDDYCNAIREKFGEEYEIIYIVQDHLDEVEAFNISWMDGYDWSKISKSSLASAILLRRFDTLELGE